MSQHFTLRLPKNASILDVQTQDGIPHIWVELDTEADTELHSFAVYCAGETMPDGALRYIGTFQIQTLVFHLYEYFYLQS